MLVCFADEDMEIRSGGSVVDRGKVCGIAKLGVSHESLCRWFNDSMELFQFDKFSQ
jgi:hypothetical protein